MSWGHCPCMKPKPSLELIVVCFGTQSLFVDQSSTIEPPDPADLKDHWVRDTSKKRTKVASLGGGGAKGTTFHIPKPTANNLSNAGKGGAKERNIRGASRLEKQEIKVTVIDPFLSHLDNKEMPLLNSFEGLKDTYNLNLCFEHTDNDVCNPILNEDIIDLPFSSAAIVTSVLSEERHQIKHSSPNLSHAIEVFSTPRAPTSPIQANLLEFDKLST